MKVDIYVDGACIVQKRIGGWAIISSDETIERYGSKEDTTNNEMELLSVLQAINACKDKYTEEIRIHSDSEYVINTMTKWASRWEANNWTKKNGPIKNLELIKEIFTLIKEYNIKFIKVKAHDGDKYNERADKLAKKAMKLIEY